MKIDKVILVDKNNKKIGTEEKIKAHLEGKLHRAFSLFVFNSKNELLLQRRAKSKYHSGNLWSNTCCSHPKPGEKLIKIIHSRLKEEMGFDCKLKKIFNFKYKIKLDNGLTENEYDEIFIGKFNKNPRINREEVMDYKWIKLNALKKDINKNPDKYTYWFRKSVNKVISFYLNNYDLE